VSVPWTLWRWYLQILANLTGKEIKNLAMTRHRRRFPGTTVDIDGVVSSFAKELAAVTFEMPD